MLYNDSMKLSALYIMGEDPATTYPNSTKVIEKLKSLDFLVVQDIFMTETAKMADVVFPAACYAEKDGTFTCTERRVQRVRKAVDPPGEAKADWQIIAALSEKMGYKMGYKSAEDIYKEINGLLPQYKGITYERIEQTGLQWPVPDEDHPGTPVLHIGQFTRGKGLFIPEDYTPPKELPDEEYPLILTTIREIPQYNFGSMTRKTKSIEALSPECFAQVSPADAEKYGIKEKDWLRLSSRRGDVKLRATITERSQEGTIAVPYHWVEVPINNLTLNGLDPLSRSPQYKVCAIRVEILGEESGN